MAGMIWGISLPSMSTLRWIYVLTPDVPDSGEYDVPVNTDVSWLAAILSDEHDPNLLASRVAVKS